MPHTHERTTQKLSPHAPTKRTNDKHSVPRSLARSPHTHTHAQVKYKSMRQTFSTLYAESGLGGFYRGVKWRFLRQAIAIFAMDKAREYFTSLLFGV